MKYSIGILLFFALALRPFPASGKQSPEHPGLQDWQVYVWDDLSVLMNPRERESFRNLMLPEDMEIWMEAFWIRRDPTPTTLFNERKEEHDKRLARARSAYPLDRSPGFDIRGRDLLLFGPPDEILFQDDWFDETGHHPGRETWIWVDSKMRADYEDRNLDGEYEEAILEMPSSRPDVASRTAGQISGEGREEARALLQDLKRSNPEIYQQMVRKLAEGEIQNILDLQSEAHTAELLLPRIRKMRGTWKDAVRKGEDQYQYKFQAEALWSVFAVDCFRASSGNTRVELSHEVRIRDLGFRWDFESSQFRARLLRRVVFFDDEDQRVSSREDSLDIHRTSVEETRSGELIPGFVAQELPPGSYRMALRLEDQQSGRLQVFTTEVEVPSFPRDSLAISDLCFLSAIREAGVENESTHGEWCLTPHPFHAYSPNLNLQLYFEIYGLQADQEGLKNYSVRYRIRRKNPKTRSSWLWTREEVIDSEISASFHDQHGEELSRHPLTVSTQTFDSDSYLIELEVEDSLSGKIAQSRGQFSIVPAGNLR